MEMITLMINGKKLTAEKGQTILQIANVNGIDIPTLCYLEQLGAYGGCGMCVVEAEGIPKLLRACSAVAADGMVVNTESDRVVRARRLALELLVSDHTGDCRGPCTLNCPAGTDCQRYVKLIAEGKFSEAAGVIKEKIPLPASIGRVCPHPCETACRRKLVEQPISIAYLKYFAADEDMKSDDRFKPAKSEATGRSVAVIGGGPGGLTAAYYLALKGHSVTVFDAMPKMGGMLRYGIPEYRLPKSILDRDIASVTELGVEFRNNVRIGKDISLAELKEKYDAVIAAVGAWRSSPMGVPGEELEGVHGGIDFLRSVAIGDPVDIGRRVAVVGGGNTAMDACRTAVRLGAEEVYVIYRRTRAEMPAEEIEINESEEEGVVYKFLYNPSEIIGENGRVRAVKLHKMKLGEPDSGGRRRPVPIEGEFETLQVDTVIMAIGQRLDPSGLEALEQTSRGNIAADTSTFRTSEEGIFAVGDAVNRGAGIAIEAIADAGSAAEVVDSYLRGCEVGYKKPCYVQKTVTARELADRERKARAVMPQRSPEERKHDFKEVNLDFDRETAIREASRCLECGCHDYYDCKLIRYARRYDVDMDKFAGDKHHCEPERKLVTIERNQEKCVLCGLCVRVCEKEAGKGILGLVGRGFTTVIKPEFEGTSVLDFCKTCRRCVQACPTGALKGI